MRLNNWSIAASYTVRRARRSRRGLRLRDHARPSRRLGPVARVPRRVRAQGSDRRPYDLRAAAL